jgi:hypothetical protein
LEGKTRKNKNDMFVCLMVFNATFNNISVIAAASDKVYQLLVGDSPGIPASFTTKTGRHDIA